MTTTRHWWHAPAKASPRRLATRLTTSLGLTGGSSVTIDRVYLDTFDWRLFRRGDALVEEQPTGGQCVLVLQSRAGERPELRVPSRGHPRHPTDLPVGLQRRLGPKLAPRTLLDVGRERVEVWPLKLLDEEDKTVAYIDVERAPSAVRVAFRSVRGYEKAADRVVALLDSQADLVSGVDPMVAAVRANGREPGELPQPPELKLRAKEDGRAALATVFEHLLVTMELHEDGVRKQLDPELLHDFRVAVRRTRSIERLARRYLPPEMARLWEQEWQWLASVTGPPRDLDVLLLDLTCERPSITVGGGTDAGIHELASRVEARRATEQAKLRDALNGDRYATLKRGWRSGIAELRASASGAVNGTYNNGNGNGNGNGEAVATVTAQQLARDTIDRASKHLMKAARQIDDDSPAAAIHRARKRAKRLRYAAEMLGGALPAKDVRSVIAHMKRLQDDLGQFQDSEVQLHLIRDLLGDPSLGGEASEQAVEAGELLMEDLVERQSAARRDLVRALRGFAKR
jgi:CHAD domain-containing protein